MMRASLTIAKREVSAYFDSPVAYIFIVAFLVVCGTLFFFFGNFFAAGQATMRGYFSMMPLVISILAPALTMRLWAEEKRQGTYELLMTMPFKDSTLVLGKYMATMAVIAMALCFSVPVPLLVSFFGSFDTGIILAEYIGALLLASAVVAIGQAVSSASRNQISAFMATVLILLGLTLLPQLTALLSLPATLSAFIHYLSLSYHFSSFSRGVIDSRDVAYFALLTIASLYATTRFLSALRWR